jgi:hypothetical protein
MGTRGSFPWGKEAGARSWPLTSIWRMLELYLRSPGSLHGLVLNELSARTLPLILAEEYYLLVEICDVSEGRITIIFRIKTKLRMHQTTGRLLCFMLVWSTTLNMAATNSFETWINFYQITWRHIPGDIKCSVSQISNNDMTSPSLHGGRNGL